MSTTGSTSTASPPGTSGTSGGSGTSGTSSPSSPVEDPTTSGSTGPPGSPKARTVRGTVSEGVEAGCLVFTPDTATTSGTWVLVGRTKGLRPGDSVMLRGRLLESGATTCNEGPPFRVDEVVTP